ELRQRKRTKVDYVQITSVQRGAGGVELVIKWSKCESVSNGGHFNDIGAAGKVGLVNGRAQRTVARAVVADSVARDGVCRVDSAVHRKGGRGRGLWPCRKVSPRA